jgi:hypothetical protein
MVTVQRAVGQAKATPTLETYSLPSMCAEDKTHTAAATLTADVLGPGVGKHSWLETSIKPVTCAFTH